MEITSHEQAEHETAVRCWVCHGEWGEDQKDWKVRDHCYFTGRYRGVAHNRCNLRLKKNMTISVLVKNLGKVFSDINVIAKNDEQHISINKKVPISKQNCWKLRFLDSCRFLQGSLEKVVENLTSAGRENFKTVCGEFEPEMVRVAQ